MAAQIFLHFLALGCVSFGGPTAHIAYFRKVFVEQRQWLSEEDFARQLALCQFLPGPASSQLGFAIALQRGGVVSACAAFLGFTLPSFLLMYALAVYSMADAPPWMQSLVAGMKLLAVVVVADALINMARQFCRGAMLWTLTLVSALALSLFMHPALQLSLMAFAALQAYVRAAPDHRPVQLELGGRDRWVLTLFALLLAIALLSSQTLAAQFYMVGSTVFGGGHVALPLLSGFVAESMSRDQFILGYAAAQAVPGPMFSVAAYLGAVLSPAQALWGAGVACIAIFLPGFLLVLGLSNAWASLAARPRVRAVVAAVNAVAVGMLAAAWVKPLLLDAPRDDASIFVALLLFAALRSGRLPLLVLIAAVAAYALWFL